MTPKEKKHMKVYDAEIKLRSQINDLLGDFARNYGLKASEILIEPNEWYKGDKSVPMFSISIVYKPCYME